MMTCNDAGFLIHALIDGELDAGHAREVEQHAVSCPRCAGELTACRDLLMKLASVDLHPRAPLELRARIDAALPRSSRVSATRRAVLKGAAFGATASALAAASLLFVVVRSDRDTRLLDEAVAAHLRSLQSDHLTDVVSSDQHTVKPWFGGRLDLSPPVVDLAAQGFTLLGGRLDYVDGRSVAALVYRRRKHIINLFVGKSLGAALPTPRAETIHGFNVRRWTDNGFALLAISDINAEELQEFADKFRAAVTGA